MGLMGSSLQQPEGKFFFPKWIYFLLLRPLSWRVGRINSLIRAEVVFCELHFSINGDIDF